MPLRNGVETNKYNNNLNNKVMTKTQETTEKHLTKFYTKDQIFEAFKLWNTDLGNNPENFVNDEAIKTIGIEKLSRDQTDDLIKYLSA